MNRKRKNRKRERVGVGTMNYFQTIITTFLALFFAFLFFNQLEKRNSITYNNKNYTCQNVFMNELNITLLEVMLKTFNKLDDQIFVVLTPKDFNSNECIFCIQKKTLMGYSTKSSCYINPIHIYSDSEFTNTTVKDGPRKLRPNSITLLSFGQIYYFEKPESFYIDYALEVLQIRRDN
jgi:hypothetical protein